MENQPNHWRNMLLSCGVLTLVFTFFASLLLVGYVIILLWA